MESDVNHSLPQGFPVFNRERQWKQVAAKEILFIYIKKFFKASVCKHKQESRDKDTESLTGQGLGLMIYLWQGQGISAAPLFLGESGSSRFSPGGSAPALQ